MNYFYWLESDTFLISALFAVLLKLAKEGIRCLLCPKALSTLGIWGCTGHHQGPAPEHHWEPLGPVPGMPQELWDQRSYHKVLWHRWSITVDAVCSPGWMKVHQWSICWVSPVQQLWFTALSDTVVSARDYSTETDILFSVLTCGTLESQENEFNLLRLCSLILIPGPSIPAIILSVFFFTLQGFFHG